MLRARAIFARMILLFLTSALWRSTSSANAQAVTYPTFTNSITTSSADPGALWLPGAGPSGSGLYIGSSTGKPFTLYGSPNLEDLFLQPQYNMETSSSQLYKGMQVNGQYVCQVGGSPSFVIWNGVLYVGFGVGPTPAPPKSPPNVVQEYAEACVVGNNQYNTTSPILVMKNLDPTDPFCQHQNRGDCWQAVNYNPSNNMDPANQPFPGRAISYLIRNQDKPQSQQELWAFYTNGPNRVVRLKDGGTPYKNNVNLNTDPVAIGESINAPSTVKEYQNFTIYQNNNYRTWEYRNNIQTNGNGANEGPFPFVTGRDPTTGYERLFATYSANSAQVGGDYLLGLMIFDGTDNNALDDMATSNGQTYPLWHKAAQPAFQGGPAMPDLTPAQSANFSSSHPEKDPRYPFNVTENVPVCGTGTNSIVKSPSGLEFWNVFVGRFDCAANPVNFTTTGSLDYYDLIAPTTRTLRIQILAGIGKNGFPNFGNPWVDGELHNRPDGENLTTKPYQTLLPASSVYLANDSRIFNVGGFMANTDGSLVAGQYGAYVLIDYQGSRIVLHGITGNSCQNGTTSTLPFIACGMIKIIADGNLTNPLVLDLSTKSANIYFDSANHLNDFPNLNSGNGRHTILMQVTGPNSSNRTATGPVTLSNVTIS